MRKERCYNGGNKHKFVARYDEKETKITKMNGTLSAEEARKLLYYDVYVKDVCIWCGKEIKRENDNV